MPLNKKSNQTDKLYSQFELGAHTSSHVTNLSYCDIMVNKRVLQISSKFDPQVTPCFQPCTKSKLHFPFKGTLRGEIVNEQCKQTIITKFDSYRELHILNLYQTLVKLTNYYFLILYSFVYFLLLIFFFVCLFYFFGFFLIFYLLFTFFSNSSFFLSFFRAFFLFFILFFFFFLFLCFSFF